MAFSAVELAISDRKIIESVVAHNCMHAGKTPVILTATGKLTTL